MQRYNFIIKILIIFLSLKKFYAQENQFRAATIGFYNVENLFDTIPSAGFVNGNLDYQDEFYHTSISQEKIPVLDTVNCKCRYSEENLKGKQIIRPLILAEDFIPTGPKTWTSQRYQQKIENLSQVIANLGRDKTKDFPVLVGLAEVENREVVQDLIHSRALEKADYGLVHFNSWDARGIDVALIYQKKRFVVHEKKKIEVEVYDEKGARDYTRDILKVGGELDGEQIYVFVNHWPSRRGGEAVSFPKREKAAQVLKAEMSAIKAKNPSVKILVMGDFNDNPTDESITKVLGAGGESEKWVNLLLRDFKKGNGTLAYRDSWNLFDQIIVSRNLLRQDFESYQVYQTRIFKPNYLETATGAYKGYPQRMFAGDQYNPQGVSDHFPVYTILLKKVE